MSKLTYGPLYSCPRCGGLVTYQYDSRRRLPRLYEAGFLARHACPQAYEPPEISFLECLCGVNVDVVGEIRYDRDSARVHVCRHTPAVPAKVRPEPRQAPAMVPDVDRSPRGVIVLD